MIQMENGTRIYPCGEWNASKRYSAVYHARKLGGRPTTRVIEGILIVWPASVDLNWRYKVVAAVHRICCGAAKLEAATFEECGQ